MRDRTATIFQSGDQVTLESTQEVFEAMTNKRVNLGEFGAATKMKLLANMMVAIHNSVAGEVLNLARKADIDPDEAVKALSKSAAGSVTFSNKAPVMISGENLSRALVHFVICLATCVGFLRSQKTLGPQPLCWTRCAGTMKPQRLKVVQIKT